MGLTEEKLTTEEINNNLLLGTDTKEWTAIYFASEKGNLELLHKLCELAKLKLKTKNIYNKLLLYTETGQLIGTN